MIDVEEKKRRKAKELRYRKPIMKNLNLDFIREDLYYIAEECENVKYWIDTDNETLINALDGDEDEADEFKMMFDTLVYECERLRDDLDSCDEYIPICFDLFFVAIADSGEILGYDEYEGDYYGIGYYEKLAAKEDSIKKIKKLTKDNLIEDATVCFRIYQAYIALRHRYDCLKASMDILKDENTGYLEIVKQIDEIYKESEKADFSEFARETKELDRLVGMMPDIAWIQ